MMKLKGIILEISEMGDYQGSPYASIRFRSDEMTKGQILKYKVDLKKFNYESLAKLRDKTGILEVEIVKGQNELASLKAFNFIPDKV